MKKVVINGSVFYVKIPLSDRISFALMIVFGVANWILILAGL